jgi:hypothetical protein
VFHDIRVSTVNRSWATAGVTERAAGEQSYQDDFHRKAGGAWVDVGADEAMPAAVKSDLGLSASTSTFHQVVYIGTIVIIAGIALAILVAVFVGLSKPFGGGGDTSSPTAQSSPENSGPAFVECPKCKGSLYEECEKCEGKGVLTEGWRTYPCPGCQGQKRVLCRKCNGNGRIKA